MLKTMYRVGKPIIHILSSQNLGTSPDFSLDPCSNPISLFIGSIQVAHSFSSCRTCSLTSFSFFFGLKTGKTTAKHFVRCV